MIGFTARNDIMATFLHLADKSRRLSKYDDELSDGQLGINEKELNSMNKHIPGNFDLVLYK